MSAKNILSVILSLLYLGTAPFVLPILAMVSFMADSGSHTMNIVGQFFLLGFIITYAIAMYVLAKAIARILGE